MGIGVDMKIPIEQMCEQVQNIEYVAKLSFTLKLKWIRKVSFENFRYTEYFFRKTPMKISICTLFEGNYHYGLAALSNSLAASGFSGSLWVGYRGALPEWLVDSPSFDSKTGRFEVTPTFNLRMVLVDTPLHFTYYKATMLRDLMSTYEPSCDVAVYIDPDIVLKCDWPTLSGWFEEDGISLVEDVNGACPPRHPRRLRWASFFSVHGLKPVRPLEHYYNAGFIGVSRSHIGFLDLWDRVCNLVIGYNKSALELKSGGSNSLFYSTDQDALNFTLSAIDIPLNTAGPEAMDFAAGGTYLSHAIGKDKPWLGHHIRKALHGVPPSAPCKAYFRFADGPIRAHSPRDLALNRLGVSVASAIGRFYRRT